VRDSLLDSLRCPFCGSRLEVVDNEALRRERGVIDTGVLGCDCCAFPVVAGVPVLIADDTTRHAMHQLEAGDTDAALLTLLGLDPERAAAFMALRDRSGPPATYREFLAVLCVDAEADNFLYRLSDPTFLTADALLRGIGQTPWTASRPALDVCGGSGHLTRVLASLPSSKGVVNADVYFWKLWMAKRFNVPGCEAVCCDANSPLPFARGTFSLAVLADAFPYIWHKRLLAEELVRAVGADGVVVMPHLHSSLGENFSAGMTRTPGGYRSLFVELEPRLFSDERLFTDVRDRQVVDLTQDLSPEALGDEPSFTLVASQRADLFRRYEVPDSDEVRGTLTINPLYRVERRDDHTVLTLTFPTPEYEEEFGACKTYLPPILRVDGDLTGAIGPVVPGVDIADLRRRRVLLDTCPDYC